jgi:hypothetical protein
MLPMKARAKTPVRRLSSGDRKRPGDGGPGIHSTGIVAVRFIDLPPKNVDSNNIFWQYVDMSNINLRKSVLCIVHVLQGLVSGAVTFLLFALANHFGPKQISEVSPVLFLPLLFTLLSWITALVIAVGEEAKVPSILCSLVTAGIGVGAAIISSQIGAPILMLGFAGFAGLGLPDGSAQEEESAN